MNRDKIMNDLLKQVIQSDDKTLFLQMLMKGKKDLDLIELLYYACKCGSLNIAKYLIEVERVNPNTMVDYISFDNGPVFKFAAESGNLKLVQYLLEICHVDIEARGQYPGTQDTALSRAAAAGQYEVVLYLLAQGANYEAITSYESLLSYAISSGVLDIVKALVSAGTQIKKYDLYKAIQTGQLEIVKYLMQEGADIHQNYIGPSMRVAIESGNVELVKFFEQNDIPIIDPSAFDPWKDAQHEILKAAAKSGNVDMMRYLVEMHHLDVAAYVQKENNNQYAYRYGTDQTILGKAVSKNFDAHKPINHLPLIRYLFDELHLVPNKGALKNLQMTGAANVAIEINAFLDSYCVESEDDKKLLLMVAEQGLNGASIPNLFRLYTAKLITEGSYCHFEKLLHQKIETLKLTNEQLKKLSKDNKDFSRDAAFYYIEHVHLDHFDKINLLLDEGLDINAINTKGENLVQYAALKGGYNHLVKFLIAKGADVDQASYNGETTINSLLRRRQLDDDSLASLFKSAKDYTNTLKSACQSPFDETLAYVLKHSKGEIGAASAKELVEAALKSGRIRELLNYVSMPVFAEMKKVLPIEQTNQLLKEGLTTNNIKLVQTAIALGANVNIKDEYGETLIRTAVRSKKNDIVCALLKAGADVNDSKTQGKFTLLHEAASLCDVAMINLLIELGAKVDSQSEDGKTPLHSVCDNNHFTTDEQMKLAIAALVDGKANINSKDNNGNTPIKWAAFWGHIDTIKYLIKLGADIKNTNFSTRSSFSSKGFEKVGELIAKVVQEMQAEKRAYAICNKMA